MKSPKAIVKAFSLCAIICQLANLGTACNVPVFRYALERWDADLYYALVVHGENGLSENEQLAYDKLRQYSISDYGVINLDIYKYTRSTFEKSDFAQFFPSGLAESDDAEIYLFHPLTAEKSGALWSATLTMEKVNRILGDTDRLNLLNRITSGTSVIMLMLDSGDPEKDEAAWSRLNEAVQVASGFLELPEGIELNDGTIIGEGYFPSDPENKLMFSIPLKLDFDLQRISRTHENEVLISSLLSVDPKLTADPTEPMVFPVFGRGRFIYPMVGEEISEDNVLYVTHYVCGACSCEIKAQNPGMDLPILMDWEAVLTGDEHLARMEDILSEAAVASTSIPARDSTASFEPSRLFSVGLLIVGVSLLIGIAAYLRSRLS